MSSCSSLLPEEQVLCSICLEVFNAPVFIACGHNFCKVCISNYWDTTDLYKCPLCKDTFYRRPELRVNTTLRDVIENVKKMKVSDKEKCPAGAGEVPCDVCTGTKELQALKSCLVCQGKTHMGPRLRNPALKNNEPIIGVLAQEVKTKHEPNISSYIGASYVKFLESGGARVVPIMINQTLEEYKRLFNSINGILYPGGGASIISSGYATAARILYELAIEANSKGDYFPVWGTCLGFEELMYLTSGRNLLSRTNTRGVPLPLILTNESKDSRLFSGFPAELLDALATESITDNSHVWSLTTESFESNAELKKFYKVLSTSTDGKVEFISTVEAYDYPIYGIQWHPEKNAFEWKKPSIPHSASAIKTTFYTADFLVSEARKNFHRFDNEDEKKNALIYKYSPVDGGINYEQIYYF